MKKRGLASPDLADALAVTFGAEVRAKAGVQSAVRRRPSRSRDPF